MILYLLISLTYFVATWGDNSNTGGLNDPWRDISYAVSRIHAGDSVLVMRGTYYEQIFIEISGTSESTTIIMPFRSDTVIIDGQHSPIQDWGGLIYIRNTNFLEFRGFFIRHAGPGDNAAGILCENSSNIKIIGNHTYNTTSSGIGVWNSHNIIIDSNEVVLACNDGEEECITVDNSQIVRVSHNYIHDSGPGSMGGEGIDAKNGSYHVEIFKNILERINRVGIYIDAWNTYTHQISVYQNLIYQCTDGIAISSENGGLLEDVNIFNNIVCFNENYGIVISNWGDTLINHPITGIKIVNNTVYGNGNHNWGAGISVENSDIRNVIIRNNISVENTIYQIIAETEDYGVPLSEISCDHNLISGVNLVFPDSLLLGCIVANPSFINPQIRDFHLTAQSPAIDAGIGEGAPDFDFEGNPRPLGEDWDIGAYEFVPVKVNEFTRVTDRFMPSQDEIVYDMMGRRVSGLKKLKSGIYIVCRKSQNGTLSKMKVILIK